MPAPGSMWKTVSISRRTVGASEGGTPSSEEMTSEGSGAANCVTRSKVPPSSHSSRKPRHSSRMRCSSAATRRGVKARDTSARRRVCSGGSMKIISPVSRGSSVISSSTVPCAEL